MRLLLDTHALLWFRAGSVKLSRTAKAAIEDPANEVIVSVASLWELAIKISLNRLTLEDSLADFSKRIVIESAIEIATIEVRHVFALAAMPFHHRDPFDRLLASHCLSDGLELVSADEILDKYGVRRVW